MSSSGTMRFMHPIPTPFLLQFSGAWRNYEVGQGMYRCIHACSLICVSRPFPDMQVQVTEEHGRKGVIELIVDFGQSQL